MERFLGLYTKTNQGAVRANRDNVAERLGFLGRIVHGAKARAWLKYLRLKLAEPVDYPAAEAWRRFSSIRSGSLSCL